MLLSNPLLLLKWVFVVLKAFSLIFPVAPLPPAAPSWIAGSLCSSGTGAVWALMGNIWYWDQQAETVEALLSKIQTTSVNLFFFPDYRQYFFFQDSTQTPPSDRLQSLCSPLWEGQ